MTALTILQVLAVVAIQTELSNKHDEKRGVSMMLEEQGIPDVVENGSQRLGVLILEFRG